MKKQWLIIRTAIFYLIGLMNTAFIKAENIGSWENYLGYAILILAVIDTFVIIKNIFGKINRKLKMKSSLLLFLLLLIFVGCKEDKNDPYKIVDLAFHLAETDSADGLIEYAFRDSVEKFYLHREVLSDNSDIADALVKEMNNEFVILIDFTEKGKLKWSKITGENIGKNIAILIDKKLVTAPIIRARIDQGKAIINGGFTQDEAEIIAEGIKTK